jgi:hypothetical protein
MNRDTELTILDYALTSLLDNFMYEMEDYEGSGMTEEDIRDLQVSIFREIQARSRANDTH